MRWTLLGLAAALLGPALVAGFGELVGGREASLPLHAAGVAAIAALAAAVAWIAVRREGLRARDLGFRRPTVASAALAIGLTALFVVALGPLFAAVLAALQTTSFDQGIGRLAALPRPYLAVVIVVVSSLEEWLYRAYAIERLTWLTGSTWCAATISVAIFALAHVPLWGAAPALTTAVSGAVYAAAYVWRRDVLPLMAAHVATNLVGLL